MDSRTDIEFDGQRSLWANKSKAFVHVNIVSVSTGRLRRVQRRGNEENDSPPIFKFVSPYF